MYLSFKVVLVLSSIGALVAGQMTSIGEAYQAFGNCDNRLTMDRYIARAPSIENYWNGTLKLTEWNNLTEARISLELSAPAVLTVDEEDGRILVSGGAYHISLFNKPEGYQYFKFHVQGKRDRGFPNVMKLTLNDQDICPNPKQWYNVIILGSGGNVGVIEEKISNTDSHENCGKKFIRDQSVLSEEGNWPWHASIYHIMSTSITPQLCVGTLISYKTILTSAHCVFKESGIIKPSELLIRLGLFNRIIIGPNTQHNLVKEIIYNDEFNSANFENDIAILKLAIDVTPSEYVRPVCLWPENKNILDSIDNSRGTILGYGLRSTNETSDTLSGSEMSVVSNMECLTNNGSVLSDKSFCAKYRNDSKFCNADRGGGIYFQKDNTYYIRGVLVSTISPDNKSVCNDTQFVVFTDIAKYLNWIESNL